MSSYPPPPPPPGGWPPPPGQYPPQWDRNAARAQRQAMKMQARMMRQQMRMQRRMMRRGSIVGPLVLLLLGVVFLMGQTGRISWNSAFHWYASWWPLVLIGAGIVLLVEWMIDQQPGPDGTVRSTRRLGGGVVALLIFLAIAGISTRASSHYFDNEEFSAHWPFGTVNWGDLGDEHDSDGSITSVIPSGAALIIQNPHGDVQVTGNSEDGQVHVAVHKQVRAWKESDATQRQSELEPRFSSANGSLTLNVDSVTGGQADLTIEVPKQTPVTLKADHGDVSVSGVAAAVLISADHGNVELNDITGAVSVHVHYDDANVSGNNITGSVSADGHMGDVNFSEIHGSLTLDGDFFGNTHLQGVANQVSFHSSRTLFQVAQLPGQLDLDSSSLDASQLVGPVVVTTRYGKNITLERTTGSVQISNGGKGSVTLSSAGTFAPISVTNAHGAVSVGVPGSQGFVLKASTSNGDIEDDFGIASQGGDKKQTVSGTIGNGGPTVTVTTSNGDVNITKSFVEPPAPPPAPKAPAVPKVVAPATPKTSESPKPPAPPTPPKTPGSVTF